MIERGGNASRPKKKKKQTRRPSTPSTPSPSASKSRAKSQYEQYRKENPKKPEKKKDSTQEFVNAYHRGLQARQNQQSKGMATTTKPQTSNVIADLTKPKNYNMVKDAKKVAKEHKNDTYLGTKQTTTSRKIAGTNIQRDDQRLRGSGEERKQSAAQAKEYYKSQDWTNLKNDLKVKNKEGWRSALSDQGWTRSEIDKWMDSEEGKAKVKRSYKEIKRDAKNSINKGIKDEVIKANTLDSVNALTKNEFDTMVTASAMGKKQGNKFLKGSTKRFNSEDIREKIGSKTAQGALDSPFMTGALQGSSYADIFSGSVGKYNEGAKSAIEATKNKKSYFAGYGLGLAGQMTMGGVATKGASLAEMTGKGVAKLAGKGAYKGVTKEIAEEAIEEYAKLSGKQLAGRFAKNRVGELAAETPVNILDAAKMSMDADGKLNKDEFKKWLVINSAFTFGVGGAMEGVGAKLTSNLGEKTMELLGKQQAGTITREEAEKLAKNIDKLKNKAKNSNVGGDIAYNTVADIKNSAKEVKRAKQIAKSKQKLKAKQESDAIRRRERYAEYLKENEERVIKSKEAREAKAKAQKHAEGAEASATRSREIEAQRLRDQELKLQKKLARAEKAVENDNTLMGHARAVAEKEEIEKALKITKEQLGRAERGTVKGRFVENAKKLKKDNTLAGHEKAARERDALIAEVKANTDRAFGDLTEAEKAMEAKDLETVREITSREKRIKEINEELDSYKEWKKDVPKDDAVHAEITQRKKDLRNERKRLQNQIKKINSTSSEAPKTEAKNAEVPTTRIDEIDAELSEIHQAQLASKDATEIRELNAKAKELNSEKKDILAKGKTKNERPEGGYATFDKEEGEAELESVGLGTEKNKSQGLHLEPKEGQTTYEAYKEHKENIHNKETEAKHQEAQEKAVTETKRQKSLWRTIVQKFVSDLEPFERMAMEGETKADRKRGRTTINGMLTARAKAMQKIRDEGMAIFEKRKLHKNAEKARDYDEYVVLSHDLERLKQKAIYARKNGYVYRIDFGEGVVEKVKYDGAVELSRSKTKDLPIDKKVWNSLKDKSEDEIRAYVEKYVKDNDLDWDQLILNKSLTGLDEATIKGSLADLEKMYGKDIKAFQKELCAYHKDLLKEDLRGGIISKERYFKLVSKYKHYVPTFRDYKSLSSRSFNEDLSAANLYNLKSKAFGDVDIDIIPQYTQMIAKTNSVMKRVSENEMLNAIAKINGMKPTELPHGHTPDELIEVTTGVYKEANTGNHMIYFRQNGKGVTMQISEEAFHAIKRWSGAEKAAIMELKLWDTKFGKAAVAVTHGGSRAFKALITDYSIIFGCRNFVRDTATALVYSEHPAQWLTHLPKAAMAIVNKKSPYHAMMEQYIKDGGRYSALVTSTDLGKMPRIGKKEGIPGLRVIKDFNTAMETLPRMSEYIATVERLAKKDGISMDKALKTRTITQEAMYNAKEVTLNFDRKGQYGAMLNRGLVPFFNPSIQGIDKLRRFLYADNKEMSEFLAMGAKVGGMVVAPTAIFEALVNMDEMPGFIPDALNHAPGHKMESGMGEAYRKLSAYNKYAYFCIPMGKDKDGDWEFLKIPRAREMAAMQLPLDWFVQNVKWQNRDGTANLFESGKQAIKLGIEQIGPVNPISDNIFSPIWNLAHNKTWMGGQIEGWDDQNKRKQMNVSDIYDSDTSSASVAIMSLINAKANKTLDKMGIGADAQRWIKQHEVSPKQLDNFFDSYLGVIYDMGIRPFSQKGASLEAVKNNPTEEIKQWAETTFGTAFVVNGTLSSQRKTGMYSKLVDFKDKVEDYPDGSKEKADANAELKKFQNNCVYDVQGLDTAIDAINKNNKYTGRQKAELTKILKREQNAIIDDYNDGKNVVHDPLKTMLKLKDENGNRVFTDDEVFTQLTFTSSKGDNKIASSWNNMKESDYYKENPTKAVREFKEITLGAREMSGKMGGSKSYMDYTSIAVLCEDKKSKNGKDYSNVLDSYGIYSSSKKVADVYVNDMGGSADTYVGSHRHIVEGANRLGLDNEGDLKSHDYAMILANAKTKNGNPLKDRAYWVENQNKYGNHSYALDRMNYARCLSSDKYADSKWTYRKVHKFADKYDLDYNSSDEKIAESIEKQYPEKTAEEKAALFGVIKPNGENPFGDVGDYGLNGDSGYEPGSGGGHGRRRGRRRRGGGGSGGGSSYTPIVTSLGSASSGRASASSLPKGKVSKTKFKSNLDDAYRRQLKKLREQTRK